MRIDESLPFVFVHVAGAVTNRAPQLEESRAESFEAPRSYGESRHAQSECDLDVRQDSVLERFIAEWVAANGSRDQQERHNAGLLSMNEAIEGIADDVFAPFGAWPRYTYDGAHVLQGHLRRRAGYQSAVVTARALAVTDANATEATPDQWQAVQRARARALVPNATVTLRTHRFDVEGRSNGASVDVAWTRGDPECGPPHCEA